MPFNHDNDFHEKPISLSRRFSSQKGRTSRDQTLRMKERSRGEPSAFYPSTIPWLPLLLLPISTTITQPNLPCHRLYYTHPHPQTGFMATASASSIHSTFTHSPPHPSSSTGPNPQLNGPSVTLFAYVFVAVALTAVFLAGSVFLYMSTCLFGEKRDHRRSIEAHPHLALPSLD